MKTMWKIVLLAILVLSIVALVGCNRADQGEAEIMSPMEDEDQEYQTWGDDEGDAVTGAEDNDEHESSVIGEDDPVFVATVAIVDGIEITGEDVFLEIEWVEHMLFYDYIALFPDDMAFDYDKEFRDGKTFGRVVLEEAAKYAAISKLFEEYANLHGIEGDESMHIVWSVIFAIMEDSEKFAAFEEYMPEETVSSLEDVAAGILERAQAGEDFRTLVETYGQDPGMQGNPDGYTFTSGVMVTSFEEATRELEIGEISGIVWSDFGIHIIKRVEPDPTNVMRPQGGPAEEGEELLAAMHILLMDETATSYEDRMVEAIFAGFEAQLDRSDFVLLPALDDVPLGMQ